MGTDTQPPIQCSHDNPKPLVMCKLRASACSWRSPQAPTRREDSGKRPEELKLEMSPLFTWDGS